MKSKVLDEVLNWFNHEIDILKKEIDSRNETINTLQRLVDELTEFDKHSDHKGKFQELSLEYEKEKERLVKLHHHYRNIEIEYDNLQKKVRGWEDWFYSNKDIFDRLLSSAPPMTIIESEDKPSEQSNKKKKQKKKKKNK
jgi:hypothetical protein